jgi:hypothetical protein
MLAGHALLFDDLTQLEGNSLSFTQIRNQIKTNFKLKREQIIESEIFSIFGINKEFFINSLNNPIPNPYIHAILDRVTNFKLNTGILLAGLDNSVAKICEINEFGILDLRPMNFHTIGSGQIQAQNTLLFQKHSKNTPLKETIYNVYKAKRNAEVMEGVGKETEILILCPNHNLIQLGEKDLNTLSSIYEEELCYGRRHKKLGELKCI